MESCKLVNIHWPFTILGVIAAALTVLLCMTGAYYPFTYSLSISLPAIKSCGIQFLCSMWSFLLRTKEDDKEEEEPPTSTSRYLFLLINLIIFFILISLHLQQKHAASAAAAAGCKLSRRQKRGGHARRCKLQAEAGCNSVQTNLQASAISLAEFKREDITEAAYMASKLADVSCLGSREVSAAAAKRGSQVQEASSLLLCVEGTKTSLSADEINAAVRAGASMGTLQLPADQYPDENGFPQDDHDSQRATVDRIVLEEDGRLRLIDVIDGSDAAKLEDGGRLGWIDRPLPTAARRIKKPVKARTKSYAQSSNHCPHYIDYHSHINGPFAPSTHISSVDATTNSSSCLPSGVDILACQSHLGPHSLTDSEHTTHDHPKVRNAQSTFSSRAHAKSMDATNGNTPPCDVSRHEYRTTNRSHANVVRRAPRVMRHQPSIIEQDELNARVESFIAKFNEQIKIQRQQSLLSYIQMVDRGA